MAEKGIYHNGSSEQPCNIVLDDRAVYIYPQNDSQELQIWNLQNTSAVMHGDTLTLTKNKHPEQTLQCSGSIAQQIYTAWQQPKSVEQPKSTLSRNVYLFIIAIVVAFLGICVLLYIYVLPWIAEKSVALMPVGVEIQMGENLARVYEQHDGTTDSANYYLNAFVSQLRVDSKYPLRVEVITSPEINAFALPGGRIFIYSGLLEKMDSYEELTALLGHEITHVVHQHSLKSIFRSAAANMVISALFGNASSLTPWVLSKANDFKQLDYSRDLETEADNEGFALMVRNNIDPNGMLQLLQILKKEGEEMPAMMKYLSTHPDTDARIKNISEKPDLKNKFFGNAEMSRLFAHLKANVK